MMDDIEQALSGLPQESPPPEIVLAAVRAFRYRTIALVASIVAGALLLGVVWRFVGPENLGAEAGSSSPIPAMTLTDHCRSRSG